MALMHPSLIAALLSFLIGSTNIPFCIRGNKINIFALGFCYGMSVANLIVYFAGA